jgi:hypothetical protein
VEGVILSQLGKDNFLYLIGFCYHKFSFAVINYEIHDKELLSIVDVFEKWRHLLEGIQDEITMYSYHKNL